MATIKISFKLQFGTKKDDESNVWVGYCPALDLYSQGDSADQAEEAAVSAATLYIGTCYERDLLHSVLREKGMKKVSGANALDESSQYITISGYDRTNERSVPLSLLAAMEGELVCQ